MIAVGKGDPVVAIVRPRRKEPAYQAYRRSEDAGQAMLTGADADVEVWPTGVYVAMQPVKERISRRAAGFAGESSGRGTDWASAAFTAHHHSPWSFYVLRRCLRLVLADEPLLEAMSQGGGTLSILRMGAGHIPAGAVLPHPHATFS